ncbi:hypothetical protein M9H77_20766 [Catharanthus roseus]|uniref:Uncharacterized protein n=1 Tax=Catharanthus roseus TaxID=4058 RepID=A0ACC0ANC5_CATRO|nr:hypothetical protein M9H77_20766 [Catharanthus roseus]
MASFSSWPTAAKGKESENKKEGDKKEETSNAKYKDMHVTLNYEFIEYLKNLKELPEMEPPMGNNLKASTSTEDKMEEMSKRTFDFDDVLKNKFIEEAIAWENDPGVIFANDPTKEAKKN